MSDLVSQLRLRDRRVVVLGGPDRVLGLVRTLLDRGADVVVIAEHVATSIQDLAERGVLTWHARGYEAGDLDLARLLVVSPSEAAATPEQRDALAQAVRAADDADVLVVELDGGAASDAGGVGPVGAGGAVGSVVLVGGGPGDPGLITVAGLAAVREADVLVVDRLAPLELLRDLPPHVQVIDVAKIPRGRFTPQERINEVLLEYARAGKRVARLKGGDSFVFGRGMEEVLACREAGIPVDVIPGVTSAVAAPEVAGIPVTHRGVVQGFAVVSGHAAPDDPRSTVDWDALAASGLTIVVLMGVETLPRIAATLVAGGRNPNTPVACVMDAATARQRVVTSTIGQLVEQGTPAQVGPPAVTVIGDVAAFASAG